MYFDFDLPTEHDICRVLMRFIGQLADLDDKVHHDLVLNLYKRYPVEAPSLNSTTETLIAVIKRFGVKVSKVARATCILVDGLDELNHEADHRTDLNSMINCLDNIQFHTGCGVIISSRYDAFNASNILGHYKREEIVAAPEDVQEWVKKLLPTSKIRYLVKKCPEMEVEISEAVTEGSGGL